MNRKLQHTMTALSATAAVLGLMLLAGAPPRPVEPDFAAIVASATQEADAAGVADATEAGTDAGAETGPARSSQARRARTAIALPYFSIAQGLRRATGS